MAKGILLRREINHRLPTSSHPPPSLHCSELIKLEPIVQLSTAQLVGYEALTLLPSGMDSETFFQQLSQQALHDLFFQQIEILRTYPQNIRYFLNLPTKVLLDDDALPPKLHQYSSNIAIELQDPETFYTLNAGEQYRLYEKIQQFEAYGFPVWLDDIDEKMLATFSNENWRLSGIKLDKKTFWNLLSTPQKMRQIIFIGHKIAAAVLAEGIESAEQRNIAFYSGATMGQGYLWPAILPNRN